MKRKLLFIIALIISLVLTSTFVNASPINYKAHLSNENPSIMTKGQGHVIFNVSTNRDWIDFKLNVTNIENVTMAHIHVAETPGGDGPPVVWLYPSAPPALLIPGRTNGPLNDDTIIALDFVGPFVEKTIEDLLTAFDEGRAYVNVHTTAYPGGEIRGTIG
ncbi:MAG: CHRD domain-containing protein [Saccharofermentanales bacterium]